MEIPNRRKIVDTGYLHLSQHAHPGRALRPAKPGGQAARWTMLLSLHMITQTFAVRKQFEGKAGVIFILGTSSWTEHDQDSSLVEESQKYGDILQGQIEDSYDNVKYKSFLSYIWIYR